MSPKDKPLAWLHGEVKTPPFSDAARLEAGFLLRQLQQAVMLSMPHSRPMPSIGRRCHELRINDADGTWRIICRVDRDAIVIAEVFAKKTQKTPDEVVRKAREDSRNMTMRADKRKNLEAKGWKVGGANDFLGLTDGEAAYIELRLKLAQGLKAKRSQQGLSQTELAKAVRSSQSRVAKMEAGDPTVSLDLLVRSLLALGASDRELGQIISRGRKAI